ncbi:MAG: flagellar motor protein MotA [Alphaproteobacteria bacterium]|nr:flagellar motor protein MotA [Alphaproteobacteria bacterium]
MNSLKRYLTRMFLFLAAVAGVVGVLFGQLYEAFLANPGLNGLILGVLLLGIVYIIRQVFQLNGEERWLQNFRRGKPGLSVQEAPRLLAPMAAMLGERKGRFSLSAMALRSLLDGIASRLDEQRDLSRYLIGLLIFLGLLGTFWGLLQTIRSVADVIGGLSVAGGELGAVFNDLKSGLRAPLTGMGTAFSSSLFGLAGSLVLGFLELQAGQAQNRFYNDLEDWLAGQTRLSSGLALGEGGDQAVPAYVQALLEQTADSLESLQRTLERGEESRISANKGIVSLSDKLGTLTDQMRTEQSLMMKLAETQMEIKPILARMADSVHAGGNTGLDESVRGNIRNIDVQMARLLEDMSSGRTEMVSELRSEIRVLSRTLAAIAEKAGR